MLMYKDSSQPIAMHNFCAQRIDIIVSEKILYQVVSKVWIHLTRFIVDLQFTRTILASS